MFQKFFCIVLRPRQRVHPVGERSRGANAAPPEIVIQKRSFLDSGRVVPRDSMRNYVTMDTILREPVYNNQRGMLGLETLPRRFDPPGRPVPLFEF